jgi:putative transcriptional regulator
MSPEGKTSKPVRRKAAGIGDNSSGDGYLDGRLLIAMPVMGDPRFERSVIYMCAHSSEGAMGIIVNRPAGSIDFPGLLVQLDIIQKARSRCRKTPRPCRC